MHTASILRLEQVTKSFGDILAVRDITVEVRRHEILPLLGPNDAGSWAEVRRWIREA